MSKSVGKDCKFYHSDSNLGSTSSGASGPSTLTWTETDRVSDLTVSLEKGEADVSDRGSTYNEYLGTNKDATLEFTLWWDPDDASVTAIRDAYLDDSLIALAAMDGDVESSGSQGLTANFTITGFSQNQPLQEGVAIDVTARPSEYTEWYEVV